MLSNVRRFLGVLLLSLLAAPLRATWSIILIDTRTGEIAIASATCLVGFDLPLNASVVVVGYGAAMTCTAGCTPGCGGSTTLQCCVTAPQSRGPFTLTVTGDDGSTATQSTFGDPSGTACLNFNVSPSKSPTTTYTLTVTDKDGCTRTATKAIDVTALTVSITPPSSPGCNGILAYSASVTGGSGCSFTWTVDGQSLATFLAGGGADDARVARASGTGNASFAFRALDGTCHTIGVSTSCPTANGACTGSASTTAKQCVGNTLNCTP